MAVAVYLNQHNELVIRQEGAFHPDEDTWIVVAPGNVPAVIGAMQRTMGIAADMPAKDPTAAERQRRRRDKRNGHGNVTVGGRDSVRAGDRDSDQGDLIEPLRAAE
jgi:hypothetical protein